MLWLMVLHTGMRKLVLSHRHLGRGGQAFHQRPAQTSPTRCFSSKLSSLDFRINLSEIKTGSSQLYYTLVVFILLFCYSGFRRLEKVDLTTNREGFPSSEDFYKWPRVHRQLYTIISRNQECSPVKGGGEVKQRGNLPCTLLHCG